MTSRQTNRLIDTLSVSVFESDRPATATWVKTEATITFPKTLESDFYPGRRPDKPWLPGWTNQISPFLPLGALVLSVRTSDRASAGTATQGIHSGYAFMVLNRGRGQICQKASS